MVEYHELRQQLENYYKGYVMTGNENAKIAILLKDAMTAISALMYERDMLEHQLNIAENEIMRRDDEMHQIIDGEIKKVDGFLKTSYVIGDCNACQHEDKPLCNGCVIKK